MTIDNNSSNFDTSELKLTVENSLLQFMKLIIEIEQVPKYF